MIWMKIKEETDNQSIYLRAEDFWQFTFLVFQLKAHINLVSQLSHLFWFGGVLGRNPSLPPFLFKLGFIPPLPSAAFKIEKLHINVSSTDINAPELSNSPQ